MATEAIGKFFGRLIEYEAKEMAPRTAEVLGTELLETGSRIDAQFGKTLEREFAIEATTAESQLGKINGRTIAEIVAPLREGNVIGALEHISPNLANVVENNAPLRALMEAKIQRWPAVQLRNISRNAEALEKMFPEFREFQYDATKATEALTKSRPTALRKLLDFVNANKKTIAFGGVGTATALVTLKEVDRVREAISGCTLISNVGEASEKTCKVLSLTCNAHLQNVDSDYIPACTLEPPKVQNPCRTDGTETRDCADCSNEQIFRDIPHDKHLDMVYVCRHATVAEAIAQLSHRNFEHLVNTIGEIAEPLTTAIGHWMYYIAGGLLFLLVLLYFVFRK